jgi:tetratricopeptide (TPR) repeat protein
MTMAAESEPVVPQDIVEEERTAATPEEETSEAEAQPPVTIWDRLRRLLFPGVNRGERLQQLNEAIADSPNAAVHYLLRGELYLERREVALATADFEEAAALAQQQIDAERWGIAAQAIQDKALHYLERLAE